LIEKWQGQGRLLYAITPRFAIASTDEQLQLAGKLLQEFPDGYLHTHLSENPREVHSLEDKLGNFESGKEADFLVLAPRATPPMAIRNAEIPAQSLKDLAETAFGRMVLGDDRAIYAVYIAGAVAYKVSGLQK
jgi:cytosine/adenosine deaminase-related metal-dependent hydrolase